MRNGILWMLLLAVAVPAQSKTLRRCVGKAGVVSFQQAPCAPDSRESWAREVTPEAAPTAEQLRTRRLREERDRADSAYLSRLAGTDGRGRRATRMEQPKPQPDLCAAARAHREQVLQNVGLDRTYDLLRSLNDNVHRHCR